MSDPNLTLVNIANAPEAGSVEQLMLVLSVTVQQLLLEHHHGKVLNALLSTYINQVVRCPQCTANAARHLPLLAAQLTSIAAAMGYAPREGENVH